MNCGFLVPDFVCGTVIWFQTWWLWLVVGCGVVAYAAALALAKSMFGWPGVMALNTLIVGAVAYLFGRRANKPAPAPAPEPATRRGRRVVKPRTTIKKRLEDILAERTGR